VDKYSMTTAKSDRYNPSSAKLDRYKSQRVVI